MLFFPYENNSLWCFRITGCEQDDDSSEYEVSFTYISFINLIIIHLDVFFGNVNSHSLIWSFSAGRAGTLFYWSSTASRSGERVDRAEPVTHSELHEVGGDGGRTPTIHSYGWEENVWIYGPPSISIIRSFITHVNPLFLLCWFCLRCIANRMKSS